MKTRGVLVPLRVSLGHPNRDPNDSELTRETCSLSCKSEEVVTAGVTLLFLASLGT